MAEGRAREALAVCVLEGFLGVRRYLETAAQRMLWVDPQLSNNEDLGRCLVAWEDGNGPGGQRRHNEYGFKQMQKAFLV